MTSTLSTLIHVPLTIEQVTENYTLSLHDALPISATVTDFGAHLEPMLRVQPNETFKIETQDNFFGAINSEEVLPSPDQDRKSTRLNSSHVAISYAVFCLKKKKEDSENGELTVGIE